MSYDNDKSVITSELSPDKMIETSRAKNIIMNAILIGIQRAINRVGKENNIPPSVTMNMVKEAQQGGGPVFSALKTAGDVYNYKKTAAKQLEKLGLDRETAQQLRSASSLEDIKNIGVKRLKKFGNVPPPPSQGFGASPFKGFKQRVGLEKKEPETLSKDDLRRIGVEGLKKTGLTKRLGITDEQLNKVDSISPDKIKELGKQAIIKKLKETGMLDKIGMNEQELESLDIAQLKMLAKEASMEKLNQMGFNPAGLKEDFYKTLSPDNPDYQMDTGPLAVSKMAANAKNMYVGGIKKLIIAADFFASKIIDAATQGALNTPISELTAKTNNRVLVLAAYLRELANNPEQLKAIEEISEALGVMGIEFIDTIKPSIDKIVDKLIESSQEVGSRAASGGMKTFIAIGSSIIAEVPGVGGVVDMIISIAIGFNSFMRVVRTFIESNSEVAVDSAEAAGKTIGTVRRNTNRIMGMVENLKNAIPTAIPVPTEGENLPISYPVQNTQTQAGGKKYSNSYRMAKSRKRIENSVLRFKNLNGEKKYNCHTHCSRTRKNIYY